MKRAIAALLLAATPVALGAQALTPAITAALADPARPAAEKERDAARHAGAVIAFMGVKPGAKVADFIPGGGYWTHILAPLVGPKGHVYAYSPGESLGSAEAIAKQKAAVAGYANVTTLGDPLAAVSFPEPLDAIITVQNWHDLHLTRWPAGTAATAAKRLYAALKPGGVLLVADHVANADPGFAAPQTLHRIDPAAARAEIEAAGFRFDGELAVLRNPDDPRTAGVFDATIRGKTDQFVYRFRKPK
ncbi:methyltransferase [Sphingomonas sp.]|uniref:class I SAM-dependent methyltransferase n=1 Tax=Sphingomonas sp. TaxID=28214 RepID=UPI002C751C62|nr:methyltransferase [Sphingomonas sp.]HWK36276.1 methyltransferase [Sphingomonas sp.]